MLSDQALRAQPKAVFKTCMYIVIGKTFIVVAGKWMLRFKIPYLFDQYALVETGS